MRWLTAQKRNSPCPPRQGRVLIVCRATVVYTALMPVEDFEHELLNRLVAVQVAQAQTAQILEAVVRRLEEWASRTKSLEEKEEARALAEALDAGRREAQNAADIALTWRALGRLGLLVGIAATGAGLLVRFA